MLSLKTVNMQKWQGAAVLRQDPTDNSGIEESLREGEQWIESIGAVCRNNWLNTIVEDDRFSYSGFDINNLVNTLQNKLPRVDFRGQRVAVCMPPSAHQAFAILAIMRMGGSPVVFNHWLKPEEVAKRLKSLGGFLVLTCRPQSQFNEQKGIAEIFVGQSVCRVLSATEINDNHYSPRNLGECMVIFTSGSMGEPKAISISYKALNYVTKTLISYLKLDRNTKAIVTLPMFHTMALNTQFLPTILAGGTAKIEHIELSMNQLYRKIVESDSNFVAMLCDMLPLCAKEKARRGDIVATNVKDVQLAGGVIRKEDLALVKELFPNARVHKGYGMTETIRTTMLSSEHPKFFTSAIGSPLPGQEVQVRNELGEVCAPGDLGEFYVKSPTVALEYINAGREMRKTADGFFATGDMGYKDEEGLMYFVGRGDRIFKSQGRKVSPLEIEGIARTHVEVQSAYCTATECKKRGFVPVLWIVPKQSISSESLIALLNDLKEKLENYKLPRAIVCTEAFPRLANGKIDGSALRVLWPDLQKVSYKSLPNSVKLYDINNIVQ